MGYVQLLDIELFRLKKEVSYQLLLWQDQFSIGVKGYLHLDQNYGAYCQLNVFRNYLFKNYLFFEHFNFTLYITEQGRMQGLPLLPLQHPEMAHVNF